MFRQSSEKISDSISGSILDSISGSISDSVGIKSGTSSGQSFLRSSDKEACSISSVSGVRIEVTRLELPSTEFAVLAHIPVFRTYLIRTFL